MSSDQAVQELSSGVSPELFRSAMGSVCTPVSVVTALDGARPHSTTVSAFCSLSLTPPMVMLALDRGSDLLPLLRHGARFGVNILSDGQEAIASQCARKGRDKFDDIAWVERDGVPHLVDSACWFACDVEQLVPGGDHTVILGAVVGAAHSDRAPLTYHRRVFGTHTAFGERSA